MKSDTIPKDASALSVVHTALSDRLKNVPEVSNPKPFKIEDSILDDEDLERKQEEEFLKEFEKREYKPFSLD